MLAQALLGVEKTDHNRCTSLYRLYGLHPADVGATAGLLASSRSLRRRQEPWCPFPTASSMEDGQSRRRFPLARRPGGCSFCKFW
jgi:hypothetical protein